MIPFIQPDYFEQKTEKVIFEEIVQFIVKYGSAITIEALNIEVENRTDLTEDQIKEIREINKSLNDSVVDKQWLLDTTEKWCRDRAIYLALMESIHIADGNNEKKNRDAIPSILSDALAVSFDNNIGHDYLQNYEERYEFYHRKEDKIEFDLEYFNKITKGGLPNKTLNIALAGTGVGKSLFMCHLASSVLLQGRSVLYITLEMAEERIAERIDANLLNVPIQQLVDLPRQMFENKVTNISKKTQGTLIIKEYPTASAHSGHFKALLNELALKKSFRPDIIFIDYSFGLPATADLMFALISTEELEALGQIMVKQLKNRYNDPTIYKRFIVGIDRAKMRLYDCEQTAQKDILDSGQDDEYNDEDKKPKKSFEGFKF